MIKIKFCKSQPHLLFDVDYSNVNLHQAFPKLVSSLMNYFVEELPFNKKVYLLFDNNVESLSEDGTHILHNKTGMYNPNSYEITLFVNGRHPKDILRSLAHELVHHYQNCSGKLNQPISGDPQYTQNDKYFRELEREAYERGNLIFRDWEDNYKYNNKGDR